MEQAVGIIRDTLRMSVAPLGFADTIPSGILPLVQRLVVDIP